MVAVSKSFSYRSVRAFTLVELLVVISIIGILTAIISVSLSAARANARDKARVADIANLHQALRLYAEENGQYPLYPEGVTVGTGGAIDIDLAPYLPLYQLILALVMVASTTTTTQLHLRWHRVRSGDGT
ncbi:MAG: prepilin-type N-terminal cleavage/methylation domain-containing protein [Candidatus Paceibacterota bacterium]